MTTESSPATSADVSKPEVDIVEALQYPGRAYAAIGPQQSGKSWVIRHAIAEAQRQGHRTIVIGPKLPAGEWPNCELYGPEWPEVIQGLQMIAKLAQDRREEATRRGVPTQSFPPVYVVCDDWTEQVSYLGDDAGKLLVSATTMFASCRVIPIFILHANTNRSWGNAIGKCLTENFLRIRVIAGHKNGIPDPSQSRYGILMPGEEEQRVDRELVFKQWGFIPDGAPVWPGIDSGYHQNTGHHAPEPEEDRPIPDTRYPEVRLIAPAPPRRVRVKTARGWRNFTVPLVTANNARRLYEESGSLNVVMAKLKMTGTQQVRASITKAILNIESPNYKILEA